MGLFSYLAFKLAMKGLEKGVQKGVVKLANSGVAERMGLIPPSNPSITLIGDYTSGRSSSVQYNFRFSDDGTYFYMAEEVGVWQLAHRGRFRTTIGTNPESWRGDMVPLLTLEPTTMDLIPPQEFARQARGLLEERGLPIDTIEEYQVISNLTDRSCLILAPNGDYKRPFMDRRSGFPITKVS